MTAVWCTRQVCGHTPGGWQCLLEEGATFTSSHNDSINNDGGEIWVVNFHIILWRWDGSMMLHGVEGSVKTGKIDVIISVYMKTNKPSHKWGMFRRIHTYICYYMYSTTKKGPLWTHMWNTFSKAGRQALSAGTTGIPHACGMVVFFCCCTVTEDDPAWWL